VELPQLHQDDGERHHRAGEQNQHHRAAGIEKRHQPVERAVCRQRCRQHRIAAHVSGRRAVQGRGAVLHSVVHNGQQLPSRLRRATGAALI